MKISKETARWYFQEIHVYKPHWEFVKNSNFIISTPIQSRLPEIWSWPNSYIHRDPFMWKYQKKLPGDIFKKCPCTNPFENSSKTRTSFYLLPFSPDCPEYGRDQIPISIGTHLCENIKRNCLGIFSWNSRVLTPLRIRQKHELHYICPYSVPTVPNMVLTKFIYP